MLKQIKRYHEIGFGFLGAALKFSLYPIKFLKEVLPQRGTVLDLGCGEGMLSNILAENIPGVKVVGIDRDSKRVGQASKVKMVNSDFFCVDAEDYQGENIRAIVVNDVLHHHNTEKQREILSKVSKFLCEDGVFVLKEVDAGDWLDVFWTNFWDRRLYPQDSLNFKSVEQWNKLLESLGFVLLRKHKVRHFWPASRTILVYRRVSRSAGWYNKIESSKNLSNNIAGQSKIFVTGSTGFIGENLVRTILRDYQDFKIVLPVRNKMRIPEDIRKSSQVEIIETGLSDLLEHEHELNGVKLVFHLAANSSFFANQDVLEKNVKMCQDLVDFFKNKNIERFVYASTMGAIDRAPNDDCSQLLDEKKEAHPVSFYGKSKLMGENILKESGIPYTIIRIPWCYGPGMNKNSHIRSLFEKTISGSFVSKIAWPGRVSVISVFGLARIFCEVGLSQNTKNEIFFASDGDPISFAKLFSRMGDLCGVKAGHIRLPKVFVKFLLLFKRFLPFTLKSLLIDVMSVNNGKLVSCSIVPKKRGDDFLLDVYRYINLQKYPGRIFSKAAVTGAAGGIGKSLAEKFYGEGYSLFLIDKNEEALRAFSLGLQSGYVVFDLISPLSLSDKSQVYSEILKNISDLYIFVNNAGIGQKGYFTEIDINKSISQVWLNCCVPIYFSKEVLESFSSAGSGILINIISSAAFQPLPTMAVYAASKAFLLSFTEALAVEAKTSSGIKVIGVCPSGTETNFQDNSGVKKNPKERLLSPSFVANEVFLSMNRNRFISIVGLSGLIMSFMARFIPRKLAPILWFSLMNKKR